MQRVDRLAMVVWVAALAACGGPPPPEQPPAASAQHPTVFDPLVGTLDRAKAVQQTVDEQAAEQRRKLENAER